MLYVVKLASLGIALACLNGCSITYQATYHTDELAISVSSTEEGIAMRPRRD